MEDHYRDRRKIAPNRGDRLGDGGNKRLAVDKIMLHGLRALEAQGFEIMDGDEITEKAAP